MRNIMLCSLGAAIVAATACENQQATAPRSIGAASEMSDGRVSAHPGRVSELPSALGKPTDQVGFTHITEVASEVVVLSPGVTRGVLATCPAGTTVVSGGYNVYALVNGAAPPVVVSSKGVLGGGSWGVGVTNTLPGAGTANFVVYAYCAS